MDWSLIVSGSVDGLSAWSRVVSFVNGCAVGAGVDRVFLVPDEVICQYSRTVENYPRARIVVYESLPARAIFYCSKEDTQLRDWLEAGKAHVLGLNVSKSGPIH